MAVVCNLAYVLFTMTTTGMFFDGHPLAPFCEFARCSFLFLYSIRGIPLLSDALTWSGLVNVFGPLLIPRVLLALRAYFLLSAIVWGVTMAYNAYDRTTRKEKLH